MTVGQLIRQLQRYPQDMRVVVDGYEDGYDDLSPEQVSAVRIALNTGKARLGRETRRPGRPGRTTGR